MFQDTLRGNRIGKKIRNKESGEECGFEGDSYLVKVRRSIFQVEEIIFYIVRFGLFVLFGWSKIGSQDWWQGIGKCQLMIIFNDILEKGYKVFYYQNFR